MINSVNARAKQSSVEHEMNKQIMLVFVVQVTKILRVFLDANKIPHFLLVCLMLYSGICIQLVVFHAR